MVFSLFNILGLLELLFSNIDQPLYFKGFKTKTSVDSVLLPSHKSINGLIFIVKVLELQEIDISQKKFFQSFKFFSQITVH